MCRFLMYQGPETSIASLVTEPAHSLINQSTHSRERAEPLNGDGFGVAWYRPELDDRPAAFRSISPAWSNRNLASLARVTTSRVILAHVRAASPGIPVTETNCHPFTSGPYAFMHNGHVAGFRRLRREFVARISPQSYDAIDGTTDSEHVFGLFLDALAETDGGSRGADHLARSLERTIGVVLELVRGLDVNEATDLNLAVTDGRAAAATRFTTSKPVDLAASLYLHQGDRYCCVDGAARMIPADQGRGAALIASEPLSADPGWERVPPNHVVLLDEDGTTHVRPLACEA